VGNFNTPFINILKMFFENGKVSYSKKQDATNANKLFLSLGTVFI